MIGVHATAVGADAASPLIVKPGANCWRVERAHRFACVQDAADYFVLVKQALLAARHTVFVLGWDIAATIDLEPGTAATGVPRQLGELLAFIAKRRPRLRCYILIWDYGALYTLERDPLTRWRLGWRMPRQVRFGFDDRHPVAGCHHQKVVVVDDQLAFCGGIDLTGHRWDTAVHRIEEPARKTALGAAYGPYHDVQAMVAGPVATSLGALARERWRALGNERLPPLRTTTADLWPSGVTPDLTDVDVAIARTAPGSETQASIRECEQLYLDSIALAKRAIYIESQYFTNATIAAALAARLRESRGPEVVVVSPRDCEGWLERNTMGSFRDGAFRLLVAADVHQRLRLVYPAASRSADVPTFIHSKVMIVDDQLVRIGSSNLSRRSMGVDTECDLAVDAGSDPRIRTGIRHIRDRLLAEHLGLPVEAVAMGIERAGSLHGLVDAREHADRTLVPIVLKTDGGAEPSPALRATADPDEPIGFGESVDHLVPPVDVVSMRPRRFWIVPTIVIIAAVASLSSAVIGAPDAQSVRAAFEYLPDRRSSFWLGCSAFVLIGSLLVPLELLAVAAGVAFGARDGSLVALLGSVVLSAIGYAAGRVVGPSVAARWMSRRSYRSVRQLGRRGVSGVVVLRLASVASAGSIHLLSGAGRVPFMTYMAGTLIALAPTMAALGGLGALVRRALLHPSIGNAAIIGGAAALLGALALVLRMFLLVRQFSPSISRQHHRAEFG
jgi:phospholipase D1/2